MKANMTDVQAPSAAASSAAPRLAEGARHHAARYDRGLAGVPGARRSPTGRSLSGVMHAWHLYQVRVPDRNAVGDEMREAGVGTSVHFIPANQLSAYRQLLGEEECGALPVPHQPGRRGAAVAAAVPGTDGRRPGQGRHRPHRGPADPGLTVRWFPPRRLRRAAAPAAAAPPTGPFAPLLDRNEIVLAEPRGHRLLRGRRVLVTGACGTVGGALCRRVRRFGPASLCLREQGRAGAGAARGRAGRAGGRRPRHPRRGGRAGRGPRQRGRRGPRDPS